MDLAKSGFVRLRNEYGVRLDPVEDLAVIDNIIHLAEKVDTAGNAWRTRHLLNPAVTIGDITLRHLSLGAQSFFRDRVAEWFPGDDFIQNLSLAYCMAHTGTPMALWRFNEDPAGWKKAVKKWARTIGVDYLSLLDALALFEDREEERMEAILKKRKGTKADEGLLFPARSYDYGALLEILCNEYGRTPEEWLWQTSIDEVEMLFTALRERKEAEARAGRKPSGGMRAVAPDPDSSHIQWLGRFLDYVREVGEARQEEGNG